MKQVKVILNPFGGRWDKQKKINNVEQALRAANLNYELDLTEAPGHGVELARQAAREGWPAVVAGGGDGTINEIVNGLIQAADEGHVSQLGILPIGTANDLAAMLDLPRDIGVVCQRIGQANTRLLDVGQVNGHYFINNSAVGLEPVVTMVHEKMRWLKGDVRYVAAAVKGILGATPWAMRLSWDDGTYDGEVVLVSVGNSRRTGGAFYMTPQAELDDGLLDFVYARQMNRWQLFKLLPKTFKGTHIHHELVTYAQTQSLSITCSPPSPIQADGEVIDKSAAEINYRIIPAKLSVIV